MSIAEDDHDDEDILDDSDEEAIEELEALGYGPQEGKMVPRNDDQPSIVRDKRIDKILENPDVSEVHVSHKKSGLTGRRQPYVCILFRNGSIIERPLADLGSNEQPHCGGPIPEGQIEPQSHYKRPDRVSRGHMRERGGIGDWFRRTSGNFSKSEVQRFTDENGCTVVFKKLVMRKCKDRHDEHDDGGHYHHDHNDCGCGHNHQKKRRGFFS